MNLLSNRCLLAIAAVVDVALYARPTAADAKSLEARLHLPPRHLETLLQALVHANILKGMRGPAGGYQLAPGRGKITLGEIVRTVLGLTPDAPSEGGGSSKIIKKVIEPAIQKAEERLLANLDAITVEDLCAQAFAAGIVENDEILPGPKRAKS